MISIDRYYLDLQFQVKVLRSSALEYQKFFEDIMVKLYPDFQKVRPYGNLGDRKNDGFRKIKGIYFQVYAPEDPKIKLSHASKKMKVDFKELYKYWEGISKIREFHFVFNDKFSGSSPFLYKDITVLKKEFPDITFDILTTDKLKRYFFELPLEELPSLGFIIDSREEKTLLNEFLEIVKIFIDRASFKVANDILELIKSVINKHNETDLELEMALLKAQINRGLENSFGKSSETIQLKALSKTKILNSSEKGYEKLLSCLVKGIQYLNSIQNEGWQGYFGIGKPDPSTTGQVLFMYDYIGIRKNISLNTAMHFVERAAEKKDGLVFWRNPLEADIFEKKISISSTIQGIEGIIYGAENKILKNTSKEEVISTILYCSDWNKRLTSDNPKIGLWRFFMLTYLSNRLNILPLVKKNLLDSFFPFLDKENKKLKSNIDDPYGESAKGLLGLSYYNNDEIYEIIQNIVNFVIENKIKDSEEYIYWIWPQAQQYPQIPQQRPFFVTRWVTFALIRIAEVYPHIEFDEDNIYKSFNWILTKQLSDGSWKEKIDERVGPGFCAYANIVIWEYLNRYFSHKSNETKERLEEIISKNIQNKIKKKESKVFISYVRENTKEIKKICDTLEYCGIDYWRDKDDIEPGMFWKDSIRKAIRNGAYFIACFSKEMTEKSETYMNNEIIEAIEILKNKPYNSGWFIPIHLNKCDIPEIEIGASRYLNDIQAILLYEDWDSEIKRLIDKIKS